MMRTKAHATDLHCTTCTEPLGHQRCVLHSIYGVFLNNSGCRRFRYVIALPRGARTSHFDVGGVAPHEIRALVRH